MAKITNRKQFTVSGLPLGRVSGIKVISYADFQRFELNLRISQWRENKPSARLFDSPENLLAPHRPRSHLSGSAVFLPGPENSPIATPATPRRGIAVEVMPVEGTPLPQRKRAAAGYPGTLDPPSSTVVLSQSPHNSQPSQPSFGQPGFSQQNLSQSNLSQPNPSQSPSQTSQWFSPRSQHTQPTDYSDY